MHLRTDLAPHFAFYRSASMGVLAPRGWHCLELDGSSGSLLLVTPDLHAFEEMQDLRGPVVQLSWMDGATSGRFAVAWDIARLFPEHIDFALQVAADGIDGRLLPTGPNPNDVVRRAGPYAVRYTTPAGRQGLGTESRLAVDETPISGAVALIMTDGVPNTLKLVVRLAPDQASWSTAIVDQMLWTFGSDLRPTD